MVQVATYKPSNVCAREIKISYENGVILKCEFVGGCQGNTAGVSRLVEGRKIEEVISILDGIKCRGSRTGETSCPDQLAQFLKTL